MCLELRTRKPSTSWKKDRKKKKESPSKQYHFTSSPPSTYAANSPPYRYGKAKLSFRLYLICLVLCLYIFVTDLMVSIDFVLRTCAQSTVVKV